MSRGTLFFTLLIAAIIMQVVPHRHTKRLNMFFLNVFSPVLNIGLPGFSGIFRPASSTDELVSQAKYNELVKVYKNTQAALIEMHSRYETLARIRSGLPKPGPGLVRTRVTTAAISDFSQEIIVNEGSDAGLKVGQLVLCGKQSGVIGSISEVREGTATVQLVTDSGHTLMVAVWREGRENYISGKMVGNGKDACKIPLLSREYDIRVGDTVFAAPRQGLLDTPIIIGEVAAVVNDQNRPLLWDITVRPIFDRQSLSEVVVIVMNPRETNRP
ncbi:MAG: rod shape-determining protein MreC [Phycisphaerae bacterium]|nr:rod shape-determining protein MreC [Phycisphaerae bacterium]